MISKKELEWILGNDKGISSKTIWSVMTGQKTNEHFNWTPSDDHDFGRCYRLLGLFPEWRPRLGEVAAAHPSWGPLVRDWDKVSGLYEKGKGMINILADLLAEYIESAGGTVTRDANGHVCGWELHEKDR